MLWTPFLVFTAYRGYPLPATALLCSAAVAAGVAAVLSLLCGRAGGKRQAVLFALLVAVALDIQFDWFRGIAAYVVIGLLLVIFWLLRRHLAAILATMFGAVLVSTVVLGPLERYEETRLVESDASAPAEAGGGERPAGRIIHLLLDEFAGNAGLPEEIDGGAALRQAQRDFFAGQGFRLFGNAISEYEASRNSISGILNFAAGPAPYERYEGRSPFVLKHSRYFEALAEAGYDLRVYQSTYMDYCSASGYVVARCYTYRYDGTDWLKQARLADAEKLKVFFGLYVQLSSVAEAVLKTYVRLDERLRENGIALPALPEWDDSPSSVNAMATFERVIEEAVTGPSGTVYFAHLLIPHGPYAYDRGCGLRGDFSTWLSNHPPYRRASNEQERAQRYAAYFEQLRCVQVKLRELSDALEAAGLYNDTTIIVHGDHGSRIHVVPARAETLDRLEPRDYLDGFSTLFAAKAPALGPGYDAGAAPVSRLLARSIGRDDLVPDADASLQVYLEGEDDDEPWTPAPWPFSD